MKIGVPKEIKSNENRVAMSPAGVSLLTNAGHEVYIEACAGLGSGFTDTQYKEAGATISSTAAETWKHELIMKVKEPLSEEYEYFYEGMIIFAYFHLANEEQLTQELVDKKVVAIAYETVQLESNALPLLMPMSEVAGYMATQIGAEYLEKSKGGKGVLLAGIPGVKRGKVTVIGGGVVGANAAKMAVGLGATVTIIDLSSERLKQLDEMFGSTINTIVSNPLNIEKEIADSDLVVGAVLIPGSRAPTLVTEDMVKGMEPGSVIVDVAIDQGGIFETGNRMTTHDNPIYVKHGVLHYAVSNIPGNVPQTATIGLTNATIPYTIKIADKGFKQACLEDSALLKGLNIANGHITSRGVAESYNLPFRKPEDVLSEIK